MGIKHVIATDMEINTYKINGIDCASIEKVNRFRKEDPDGEIDEFYSDSYSDMPLAEIAKKAFMIGKHGEITDWDFENKKGQKKSDKLIKAYRKAAYKKAKRELIRKQRILKREEKRANKAK